MGSDLIFEVLWGAFVGMMVGGVTRLFTTGLSGEVRWHENEEIKKQIVGTRALVSPLLGIILGVFFGGLLTAVYDSNGSGDVELQIHRVVIWAIAGALIGVKGFEGEGSFCYLVLSSKSKEQWTAEDHQALKRVKVYAVIGAVAGFSIWFVGK